MPRLIQAVKDSSALVGSNAAVALGKIDSEAKAAVPALAQALKDDDDVRQYAAGALEKVNIEAEATEDTEFV